MGIDGASGLIAKKSPNSVITIRRDAFRNKRIAFDADGVLRSRYSMQRSLYIQTMSDGTEDIREDILWGQTLGSILYFIKGWLYNGITPIFVWDGKKHPMKSKCLESRRKTNISNKERIEELKNKISNSGIMVNKEDITELKKLLVRVYPPLEVRETLKRVFEILGIPSITAEYEGEKLCASLVTEGYAAAVYSDDYDNIPLGSRYTIIESDMQYAKIIINKKIYEDFDENLEWVRDLCILMGSDFTRKIKSIGPITAWNLMKQYHNIENIIRHENKYDFKDFDYENARAMFEYEESPYIKGELPIEDLNFKHSNFRDNIGGCISKYNITNVTERDMISSIISCVTPNNGKFKYKELIKYKVNEIEIEETKSSYKKSYKKKEEIKEEKIKIEIDIKRKFPKRSGEESPIKCNIVSDDEIKQEKRKTNKKLIGSAKDILAKIMHS